MSLYGCRCCKDEVSFCRYASLYFCVAIEPEDNELISLEIIHRYVELLDKYFGSVSTVSMMSPLNNLWSMWLLRVNDGYICIIPSVLALALQSYVIKVFITFLTGLWIGHHIQLWKGEPLSLKYLIMPCILPPPYLQAYFILDELVVGGEIQETSKKNIVRAITAQDMLQEVRHV